MKNVKLMMKDTQRILLARSLNKNGEGQSYFTKECAKAFDNYVPFLTGRLKNMSVSLSTSKITYSAQYASAQFYNNKGMGKQGTSLGGLRGKHWSARSWIDNGDTIVKSVARFCGGRRR